MALDRAPGQNAIAVAQFPRPHSSGIRLDATAPPDLRRSEGVGRRTVSGTRAAARTSIRYRNGVPQRSRREPARRYMEDLAPTHLRLMLASGCDIIMTSSVRATMADGRPYRAFVSAVFDESLARLVSELPAARMPHPATCAKRAGRVKR